MFGIRWIIGLPFGYLIYYGTVVLNLKIIEFSARYVPWETFWSIEALIINTFLAIYLGISFAYFMLPNDRFALVVNTKVKVLYFALSLWTVLELIALGLFIYDAVHGMFSIYHLLYPIFSIIVIWFTYSSIKFVDFKHNQPNRDYYEQLLIEEEMREKETAISQE